MNKTEEYIENIKRKLCNRQPLTDVEIRSIVSALRESNHILQEPYYEVIYHDKYGNQEGRIMNPEYRGCKKEPCSDNLYIIEDRFSVDFRRFVREEEL